MKFWQSLFLNRPFLIAYLGVVMAYFIGFFFQWMLLVANLLLFALFLLTLVDFLLLYLNKKALIGKRVTSESLSNFDDNPILIQLENHYPFPIHYLILDELPKQFQIFKFEVKGKLAAKKEKSIHYSLQPTERGLYRFGNTNVLVHSPLGLLQRRIILPTQTDIKVYPSFLKLNQYNLLNFKAQIHEIGQKKTRRIGHSMEFEQIKNYVAGDDIRTINWKSTAKHQKLMVNQYVDEKAQQVYCAIDKGRLMKMPFEGLSLLDYAINSSLVLSNIVLENQDRAGIFSFSKQIDHMIKAERRTNQLQKILENLYNIQSDFKESDFGNLYANLKYKVPQRSLIVLFTNFEGLDSMNRQLPYLKAINKNHLLLVVFFKNTALKKFIENADETTDLYHQAMMEKFMYEKHQIVLALNKNGIHTVLSHPEDLSVDTINKYLEIKSRGML